MHRTHRSIGVLLLLTGLVTLAGCKAGPGTVGTDISTSQAVLDLGQNIADMREENSLLQAQIDSLRGALAYQDSVVRQLAGLAGLPMRSPSATVP